MSATPSDELQTLLLEQAAAPAQAALDQPLTISLSRRLEWLIPLGLAIIMLAQIWASLTQLSITSDEIDHLHAGYRYLQCNDFGWNPEHPPLVKIIAALPLNAMRVNDPVPNACGLLNSKNYDFVVGHEFIFKNPERILTAARWAVSSLAFCLLLTVWIAARRMFGLPGAIIAAVLVAFDPNLLAHGGLVTTDLAATLGILLAVYALYCYCHTASGIRLLALGAATSFALCVKYSTIALVIILPALMVVDTIVSPREERRRKLLRYTTALLAVAAIAFSLIWACYGFRYSARPSGQIWTPPREVLTHGLVVNRIIPQFERAHLLPEAYLVGLKDVLVESDIGRSVFLLGKYSTSGKWFFFPVDAAIKFTLPLLLMVVLSALSLRFWRSRRKELLFLSFPILIFLALSMSAKLNIGIRHVLPILPFLTIFAAAGTWSLLRNRSWGTAALAAFLVFQVGSSVHAYPNYLCYSNELWGGPAETYRRLAYSDADWGQAQKIARDYIVRTHPENCFFLRTYHNLNSDYDIPCAGISDDQWDPLTATFTGTMIVSSNLVNGVGLQPADVAARRIFRNLVPIAKLGGSALLVYDGTFDMAPLVAVQRVFAARKIGDADPQAALTLAQEATQLDPTNGDAHTVICASYQAMGDIRKAAQECNLALRSVRQDEQYSPRQIQALKDFITRKGLPIEDDSTQQQRP